MSLKLVLLRSCLLSLVTALAAPTGPSAAFAQSMSGKTPSVAGNYACRVNPPGGFAKFGPDGAVICSSGEKGTWEVDDADSNTYVISVAGARYNVIFQPGRGFIDRIEKNLLFEIKPQARASTPTSLRKAHAAHH